MKGNLKIMINSNAKYPYQKLADGTYEFEIPVKIHSVSSPTEPMYNGSEESWEKLSGKIELDRYDVAKLITSFISNHNLPLSPELSMKAWIYLKSNVHKLLDTEFINSIQQDMAIIEKRPGAVLRETHSPYGLYQAIILDNKPIDTDGDNIDMLPSTCCVNPYCLLVGQFAFKGYDNTYDYYCPRCSVTWHWELQGGRM